MNLQISEARKENKLTLLQLEETNRKLENEANSVKDLLKKLEDSSAKVVTLQEEKKQVQSSLEASQHTAGALQEQLKVSISFFSLSSSFLLSFFFLSDPDNDVTRIRLLQALWRKRKRKVRRLCTRPPS